MVIVYQITLTITLFLVAFAAQADQTYTGKVVAVSDGDTIKILVDNRQLKIRLAEIDTSEKAQRLRRQGQAGAKRSGVW
jgi:endonuclease YncB( thermonuclease family)